MDSRPEQILSSEITRLRATVMEGVFGDHKEHYGLRKIKVKGEKREKLIVIFATMAANAVKSPGKESRKDYGSYLGNYADYGNDFSHSQTIPFNLGVQLLNDDLENREIYVILQKKGCFTRSNKSIGNPEIEYKELSCNPKKTLTVYDFDEEYILLKRL